MKSDEQASSTPSDGEVLLYEAPDGQVRVDVRLERETVWLSLTQIAKLFGRDKSVISRHLHYVFATGELKREAVVAKNATTAPDGKTYHRLTFTTWTPSSLSVTASTPDATPGSAFGRHGCCVIIC